MDETEDVPVYLDAIDRLFGRQMTSQELRTVARVLERVVETVIRASVRARGPS